MSPYFMCVNKTDYYYCIDGHTVSLWRVTGKNGTAREQGTAALSEWDKNRGTMQAIFRFIGMVTILFFHSLENRNTCAIIRWTKS